MLAFLTGAMDAADLRNHPAIPPEEAELLAKVSKLVGTIYENCPNVARVDEINEELRRSLLEKEELIANKNTEIAIAVDDALQDNAQSEMLERLNGPDEEITGPCMWWRKPPAERKRKQQAAEAARKWQAIAHALTDEGSVGRELRVKAIQNVLTDAGTSHGRSTASSSTYAGAEQKGPGAKGTRAKSTNRNVDEEFVERWCGKIDNEGVEEVE